jgi:hypothetical protein
MRNNDTFAFEKAMQRLADKFYQSAFEWDVDRDWENRRYDCLLWIDKLHSIKIEEKFVKVKHPYKYGLVEIMQDLTTANMGWYFSTDCDFLHWFECQHKNSQWHLSRLYRLKWCEFKSWFEHHIQTNGTKLKIVSEGFGLTLNLTFPWKQCIENLPSCNVFEIDEVNPHDT